MLNEAEAEKRLAYERSQQVIRLRDTNTQHDMKEQMNRIAEMEREYNRLQTSQATAQVPLQQRRRHQEYFQQRQEYCHTVLLHVYELVLSGGCKKWE